MESQDHTDKDPFSGTPLLSPPRGEVFWLALISPPWKKYGEVSGLVSPSVVNTSW